MEPHLIDPILKMPLKADSEERNIAFDQVDDAVARQRQRIGTFDSIKLLKLFVSKHIVDVDLSLILRIINACPTLEKLELTNYVVGLSHGGMLSVKSYRIICP
ncbi:hypothetical protein Tsubulata_004066 [Turnera subulata]|uniref:Uncharacterized protein n=1 Tax=Turnera subulata TaxID=218843 RepID=A0A9Q0F9M8_9ROSI|nr:hypothetical protein Tsubulata_004066 [Turnera subulata]